MASYWRENLDKTAERNIAQLELRLTEAAKIYFRMDYTLLPKYYTISGSSQSYSSGEKMEELPNIDDQEHVCKT